jgi:3-phosphoinositide dependent protein kinase-1
MKLCRHPNITRLIMTFTNTDDYCRVLELAPNGTLQTILDTVPRINVDAVRVASGQILLALAHMHTKRILHRNLRPNNVLLDDANRVKITDFGAAKIIDESEPFCLQRGSFIGSPDFTSPEVLLESPVGPLSDLWSFACILFAMLAGQPPFHDVSDFETFSKIQALDYSVPDFVPQHARELIQSILKLDASERLGHGEHESDYASIRNHPFYAGIDWRALPLTPMPSWRVASEEPPPVPPAPEPAPEPRVNSQVQALLLPGEVALVEGDIIKSRRFSRKRRRLVLTDTQRLVYVDMATKVIKGQIRLSAITDV